MTARTVDDLATAILPHAEPREQRVALIGSQPLHRRETAQRSIAGEGRHHLAPWTRNRKGFHGRRDPMPGSGACLHGRSGVRCGIVAPKFLTLRGVARLCTEFY